MDSESVKQAEDTILRIAHTERDRMALKQHVQEIVEGSAFKGIRRSARFLDYIVDRALAGQFDLLNERAIGIHLFDRPASYNPSDDSIVRVTASDVRKRLLQHYGTYGDSGPFRIDLPKRSYVPVVFCNEAFRPPEVVADSAQAAAAEAPAQASAAQVARPPLRFWMLAAVALVLLVAVWTAGKRAGKSEAAHLPDSALPAPWSTLFAGGHLTHIVTSDPNIAEIQGFLHQRISLVDYASQVYVPEPNHLTAEERFFCHAILRGDKAAAADVPIAANIAGIAHDVRGSLDVHNARNIRLADMEKDDNFIFLGSPLSNPWVSLFDNQLDFRFEFDPTAHPQGIHNLHPRPQEQEHYLATRVFATSEGNTGQSYAIVAFLQNPSQAGQVLLLAGETAEGTEAAGKLVTDLPRITGVLHDCGATQKGRPQHFELLLHLSSIAGSSSTTEVVACHLLDAR